MRYDGLRKETGMLIRVVYNNKKHDLVKEWVLDSYIESHSIDRFKRRSGWVRLGIDPVRSKAGQDGYRGNERRG